MYVSFLFLLFCAMHHMSVAQPVSDDQLVGIYYGEMREGYSQHSESVALRFYKGELVYMAQIPGEPYDIEAFERSFSKDSKARFDQGRYMVIGSNVEFTGVFAKRRMYFKGVVNAAGDNVTINFRVTNLQTKGEYNLVCRKIWPQKKPLVVEKTEEHQLEANSEKDEENKKVNHQSKTEMNGVRESDRSLKDGQNLDNLDANEQVRIEQEEKDAALASEIDEYAELYKASIKSNNLEEAAMNLNKLGATEFRAGRFEVALRNFMEALGIKSLVGDRRSMATLNNNIAVCHERLHQKEAAIMHYQESARIYSEVGMKKEAAKMMYQIALVEKNHLSLTEEQMTLEKLVEMEKTIGNEKEISGTYNNLAVSYYRSRQFEKALEILEEGIAIDKSLDYKHGLALAYNNRGNIRYEQGDLERSLQDYSRSLDLKREIGNERSEAITLHNIGNVYAVQGQVDSARTYYESSLDLAEKEEDINIMHANYKAIAGLLAQKDGCSESLEYYKMYTNLRFALDENKELKQLFEEREKYIDEQFRANASLAEDIAMLEEQRIGDLFAINLLQEDLRKQQHQAHLEIETRKQEIEILNKDKELLATENEKVESENQKKTILLAGVGLVSLLALVLFFLAYKNAQRAKRDKEKIAQQKQVVEEQKVMVEEKNKEILDSITYAKRLQSAILPPEKLFRECLPENFLIYQPKDIIAGDFYWLEKVDQYTYFAVADCTGHGVPGAMVSVVCSNALDRAVKEFGLRNTGEILNKVRELVIDTFRKSENQVKDGMDVALCRYNSMTRELQFSGANNPLWIIRKRQASDTVDSKTLANEEKILIEIKADKQPVGQHAIQEPFKEENMVLNREDSIFLFSDGYADQFGGKKGKKLKLSNLKRLIFSNIHQGMPAMKTTLENEFEKWKGDFEQIDDVCVMGVKF